MNLSPNNSAINSSSSSSTSSPSHQNHPPYQQQSHPDQRHYQPVYQKNASMPNNMYNQCPPKPSGDTRTYHPQQKYRHPPPPISSTTLPHNRRENQSQQHSYNQSHKQSKNSPTDYYQPYNSTLHSNNHSQPSIYHSSHGSQSPPVSYPNKPSQGGYANNLTQSPPAQGAYSSNHNQPQNSSYPIPHSQSQNNSYNQGIVYADLSLSHNGHTNNRYKKDYNTEYAVLQFNSQNVGQEIDV